jgi:AcrR family transcriptional regulator
MSAQSIGARRTVAPNLTQSDQDMNQHAPYGAAQAARARPSRRALAKQRTQLRVLDASRRLFEDLGYDGTTLRGVAKAAQMSTGAVFANFVNKAALFADVINADCAQLAERMDAADLGEGSTIEAVTRLVAVAQQHHADKLGLIQAAVSFAWREDSLPEGCRLTGAELIEARLTAVLVSGVESGDLRLPADARLIGRMLLDGYLASYRLAIFEKLPAEDLWALQAAQVKALLAGYEIPKR